MGNELLTLSNIQNFSFQLFVVVVTTEFTKKFLDKIYRLRGKEENNIETEFIVLGYSIVLSLIKTLSDNSLVWKNFRGACVNILLMLINSIIISYLATAGYDKIIENHRKHEEEIETVKAQMDN